jgi:hypothetical protein
MIQNNCFFDILFVFVSFFCRNKMFLLSIERGKIIVPEISKAFNLLSSFSANWHKQWEISKCYKESEAILKSYLQLKWQITEKCECTLINPFTASCENAMTLSVPGVPASCDKFPHSSQLNFWSTESIFNQFSVF